MNKKSFYLSSGQKAAILYHSLFKYPLTDTDLERWQMNKNIIFSKRLIVCEHEGYYFILGRRKDIRVRRERERWSRQKLIVANRARLILSFIPTVKMVALTGSLAMDNTDRKADIDLMIITTSGWLWTTRLISVSVLKILGMYRGATEKDKICTNMWLTEDYLDWPSTDRNVYTAHEILQIKPLLNRSSLYEKFIYKNRWIKNYWKIKIPVVDKQIIKKREGVSLWERVFYMLQYNHMSYKITNEQVGLNRAIFHPRRRSAEICAKLSRYIKTSSV